MEIILKSFYRDHICIIDLRVRSRFRLIYFGLLSPMYDSLHYGARPANAGRCAYGHEVANRCRDYFPLLSFAPEVRSVTMVKTRTVVCQMPHSPPYQFTTTLYQSMVYGMKMKPSSSQNQLSTKPVNHSEKM